MKKVVLIIFVLTLALPLNGQEGTLKFHSGTAGVGLFGMDPYGAGRWGGFTVHLDGTWQLGKHLYSLGIHVGSEVIFPVAEFQDYHVAYGRELQLGKKITLDAFAGLGYLRGVYFSNFEYVTRRTMGIPIKASLSFYLGEHFAIVLHPYVNVNTFSSIYTGSLSFRIRI